MIQTTPQASPTPFYREEFRPTEAALVRSLGIKALMSLYDAARASQEALFGTYPTTDEAEAVATWVEDETDRLADICSFAIEEMKRRPMTGQRAEDHRRASYVLAWDFHQCSKTGEEALLSLATMLEDGRRAQERRAAEDLLHAHSPSEEAGQRTRDSVRKGSAHA